MEFAHRFRYADGGICEQHRASVEIVYHSRSVQVAAHCDVDVSEPRESDIVAVRTECRVHLIAVCIVIEEITGISALCSGGEHGHSAKRECDTLYI